MAALQQFFEYGQAEVDAICMKDKAFALAAGQIGIIRREVTPDIFSALVKSMVGQQISTKAQKTIWERITGAFGSSAVSPQMILGMPIEKFQKFGVTMKKAGYIYELSQKVQSGELDITALYELPDEQVISKLCALNGVGLWTAEMLLLFSMQRPDILSFGDLAIQRGMRMLYRHRTVTREKFEKYRRRYSPHGSVASLYIWEIASGNWGYSDPAPERSLQKAVQSRLADSK